MEQQTEGLSRRDFFRAAAAGTITVAGLGALSGCASGDDTTDASTGTDTGEPTGAVDDSYNTLAQLGTTNRGENPDKKAPTTPEEYITSKGDGVLQFAMGPDPLGITPADFMLNEPAWLGDAPQISDIATTQDCDILVIGAGNAGTLAALRAQELDGSKTVFLAESQSYDEYDEYACDMACYNAKLFLNKGTPRYDPWDIANQYIRNAAGHCSWKIVYDYASRSGEALDWMVDNYIPTELTEKYAFTSNYKGNAHFSGECAGQKSFIGMTQWRDMASNINMWPYVIRFLHSALEEKGGKMLWGYQAIRLLQDASGAVTGAIFKDLDSAYQQVNAKAVIIAAGGYGGSADMRLDLSDSMRNLAWAFGSDRTDAMAIGGMGRDGSGIRMILWAGGTMESGPRAGMSIGKHGSPSFACGGAWPVFGNDGKRFFNESMYRFGTNGFLDLLPDDYMMACVTDANWETYLTYQGYGHETADRSNDYIVNEVHEQMAVYKTGPDGFPIHAWAQWGTATMPVYAADTLDEL
ncbi:MAG: FAD-binding protein, partial [Coriobacteriales bacterium]|nr:FAD-binding protein [Coriobacteriales bacterium]